MKTVHISNFPKKLHDEIRIDAIKKEKLMSEWWIEAAMEKLGKEIKEPMVLKRKKFLKSTYLDILVEDIAQAYKQNRPFTSVGKTGIYARRDELNESIRSFSKNKLYRMTLDLLKRGVIVKRIGKRKNIPQWLDTAYVETEGEFKN